MSTAWILTSTPQVSALVQAGRQLRDHVAVIAVGFDGDGIGGVDVITALIPTSPETPVEALAGAAAELIEAGEDDVVLAADRAAERALAGAAAARLGAPVLSGVTAVSAGGVQVRRFGGIVTQTVAADQRLVLVMDAGDRSDGDPAPVKRTGAAGYSAVISGEQQPSEQAVDLKRAARVVSAGRGFREAGDLELARKLATALHAELACTRPLAEGLGWLPKESYVGVSGLHLSPELYVAVGVSGQLQHMYGAQDAKRIVAINSDANAPIFGYADYGIVGDLYTLLPALSAAAAGAAAQEGA